MKDFTPNDFQLNWEYLSTRYYELDKERRVAALKEIKSRLKERPDLYPNDAMWPSTVEVRVANWPEKAIGKAGKAFIMRNTSSSGTSPVLMTSPSGKAVILDWNVALFKELSDMVGGVLGSQEEEYIWKIKNFMKDLEGSGEGYYTDEIVATVNGVLDQLFSKGLADKAKEAWSHILPDEVFPVRMYEISEEGVRHIIQCNEHAPEQLACIINDALNIFSEKDDDYLIVEDEKWALFLRSVEDEGRALEFFLAVRRVVEEGGLK